MQVVPFNSYIIRDRIDNHNIIKPQILSLIDQSNDVGINLTNENYIDQVSKLDWDNSTDQNRRWVQVFLPVLIPQLNRIVNHLGFNTIIIYDLWYQQYKKNNTHGWHIHGNNFTCVYYLELPNQAPKTELVDPLTKNILVQDVNEGDLIIFPSFTIHRAPIVECDLRKTIISFNIDFSGIKNTTFI